jgi:hypothetical protein
MAMHQDRQQARAQRSSGAACTVACLSAVVLRYLADDIGGIFVVAQALEPWVAQFPVGRPFAEGHLGE